MSINTSDWHRVDREFSDLLALDLEEQRLRLERIQREDPVLGRRLGRLLGHLGRDSGLDRLSEQLNHATRQVQFMPGTSIGSWTISKWIGSGGMSEVYEAERTLGEGVQRAALKILSMSVSGSGARASFSREIAILTQLEDAGLSRLIDAGTHSDGRPWLAMEYVEGLPIDEACDSAAKTIRERVELMIEIARVVDRAHRQLVVHRDLKPANILFDKADRARVLDFGIARLIEPELPDAALTQTTSHAYTLHYTSPEQLSGKRAGVSGDVYQLGLLIYRLLVGERAFEGQDDTPFKLIAAMHLGPELPSQRVLGLSQPVATCRSTSLRQMQRTLRGDLDSIVIRALAYEQDKRYRSAGEMADDLERWLQGRPVLAGRASALYQVSRFVRRNWLAVSASGLVLAAGLVYLAMVVHQRQQLELEKNRTQSVLDAMTEMFSVADPYEDNAAEITVQSVVEATAEQLTQEEMLDPFVQVQLMSRLATIFTSARQFDKGERLLHRAYELAKVNGVDESLQHQLILGRVSALSSNGEMNQAHDLLQSSIDELKGEALLSGRLLRAQLLSEIGSPELAVDGLTAIIDELSSVKGPDSRLANAHNSLAIIHSRRGRLNDALRHYSLALSRAPRERAPDQDLIAIIETNSAIALARLHRYHEAEAAFRRVIDWRVKTLGADHVSVATAAQMFVPLLYRTLRFESALALMSDHPINPESSLWLIHQRTYFAAKFYTGSPVEAVESMIDALDRLIANDETSGRLYMYVLDELVWGLFELGDVRNAFALAEKRLRADIGIPTEVVVMVLALLRTQLEPAESDLLNEALLQQDECARFEVDVLTRAAQDLSLVHGLTLPSTCDGARAGRMLQLGLSWTPHWADYTEMEPFESPLIRRLLSGQAVNAPGPEDLQLSVHASERIRELIGQL